MYSSLAYFKRALPKGFPYSVKNTSIGPEPFLYAYSTNLVTLFSCSLSAPILTGCFG